MFIDTHAHLTMPEFSDLPAVLERAKTAKVEAIINASFDLASSKAGVTLAHEHAFIYAAVGIHPNDANLVDEQALKEIRQLAADKKVVAIGETGLDYHHKTVAPEIQIVAFRKFLSLAQELSLPAIIHCRESAKDVIRVMREENKGELKAVFHCFPGYDELRLFAEEMGYMISFTGNITFKKAGLLREQANLIPLKRLMLETDSPYLAPDPFRGTRNDPAQVGLVAEAIAAAKNLTVEEVALETTKNAREFFKLA